MNPNQDNQPQPARPRGARDARDAQAADASARRGRKLFAVNTAPADTNPGLPLPPRRPQRSWHLWALVCVALVGGVAVWLRAQDQPAQTPVVVPVPVTSEEPDQNAVPGQMDDNGPADQNGPADDTVQTNGPGQINTLGQTNSSSRRIRRSYRRRSGSTYGADQSSGGDIVRTGARPTNSVPRPDFSTFSIITHRNIFDPNRRGDRNTNIIARPVVHSEHITLVGTMSYEKGKFAFFDGDNSEYQKALQRAGTIAGYTVTDIRPDTVKLSAGTNNVELKVGMQLRREEGGPWHVSAAPETYASSTTSAAAPSASGSATSTDSAPSGPVSDILQRLMKQREQE
jgi:hypothetical protein